MGPDPIIIFPKSIVKDYVVDKTRQYATFSDNNEEFLLNFKQITKWPQKHDEKIRPNSTKKIA